MKITITSQILSGNLGDGWNDENEAARALADYTEAAWMSDLARFIEAGHEVEISIDVQRNTSGVSRRLSVDVDPLSEESYELVQQVEGALTDEGVLWERFCSSPEAAAHFSE